MGKTCSVRTTDGNLYCGELRGGAFDVDGTRFQASSCVSIQMRWDPDSAGHYDSGHVELSDGTRLKVKMWASGFLSKQVHTSLSGHVVLFVESLGKEVEIESNQIDQLLVKAAA
jgi:hypothetical protein